MKKVFLDTNILFSYLYLYPEKSATTYILKLFYNKLIEIFISELVKNELIVNVNKKIPSKEKILLNLLENIKILPNKIINLRFENELPEKDKIILSTAIYYNMDYFLTGDRHFHKFFDKKILNTLILKQKDFLKLFS